ncbi:sensor histidine kinase [Streptomyces sp. N35]|uniref:sensor histidine kinase n=1 Tax=Streptomyces sp. N35 TaxID=2795730 RepID=UPI0018F5812B|nr:histidine kinase [Streptomyces sp. N35]
MQRRRFGGRGGDWAAVALAFLISLPNTLIRPWVDWTPLWSWPLLVSAAGSLFLLVRRRRPEVPLLAGFAVLFLAHADILVAFALYAVGRYRTLRTTLCWVAVAFLVREAFFAYVDIRYAPFDDWEMVLLTIRASTLEVVAPAAAGIVVRNYRVSELLASLRAQMRYEDVRRETLREAERKAAKERRRVARDAHDHIGHEVTLMALQANLLAAKAPDQATRTAAEGLAELAREAIGRLHEIVQALKEPGEPVDQTQPGHHVAQLVERTRRHGVDVRLVEHGCVPAPAVPCAVDELCYRVVLEGLTNAVKHAPGAPVTVTLERDEARMRVSVRNACARTGLAGTPPLPRGGHGLAGLMELASHQGGELTCGLTAEGEYELRAELPLTAVTDRSRGAADQAPGEHGDTDEAQGVRNAGRRSAGG